MCKWVMPLWSQVSRRETDVRSTDDLTAEALWHTSAASTEILEETLNSGGKCIIEACYSMISTGTERTVCMGQVDPLLDAHMHVPYQVGNFALPIKYGYSLVGSSQDGDLVHCMHPHQNRLAVAQKDTFALPSGLSAKLAALISNMETVVTGIWDAQACFAEKALPRGRIGICGFGNIGSLLAVTLRTWLSIEPIIIETDEWRKNKAKDMGFSCGEEEHPYALLFHTSSSAQGLNWCLKHAQENGIIVEMSWYGSRVIKMRLGHDFHYKRLKLISSQVSQIPPSQPKQTFLTRKQQCADLLTDSAYKTLLATPIPFDSAPDFFRQLRNRTQSDGLIWLIDYQ